VRVSSNSHSRSGQHMLIPCPIPRAVLGARPANHPHTHPAPGHHDGHLELSNGMARANWDQCGLQDSTDRDCRATDSSPQGRSKHEVTPSLSHSTATDIKLAHRRLKAYLCITQEHFDHVHRHIAHQILNHILLAILAKGHTIDSHRSPQ
jgi:hypothetical protein